MQCIVSCNNGGNKDRYLVLEEKERFWDNDVKKTCVFNNEDEAIKFVCHTSFEKNHIDKVNSDEILVASYPHPLIAEAFNMSQRKRHGRCILSVRQLDNLENIIFEKYFEGGVKIEENEKDCTMEFKYLEDKKFKKLCKTSNKVQKIPPSRLCSM